MLLKSIRLTGFLSFGDSTEAIDLLPLNILIGPNGSGKSNLIEAIELIRSAPRDLLTPIRDGGGVRDWLWKGSPKPANATIDAVFADPKGRADLRYVLSFTEVAQRFEILDERVENERPDAGESKPYIYYRFERGHGVLNVKGQKRRLQHEEIDPTASILSQRKDPDQYPEITYLGNAFSRIRQLPPAVKGVEVIATNQIFQALENATRNCKTKVRYGKGEHAFKLLSQIEPARVTAPSPWAKRFVDELAKKTGGA